MSLRDDGFWSDDERVEITVPLLRQRVSALETAKEKTDEILEKITETQATLNVQAATLAVSVSSLNESITKLQKESSLQTKILSAIVAALMGLLVTALTKKLTGA